MDARSTVLTESMYQPWKVGEPNGDTLENCAAAWVARGKWNDHVCEREFCAFCELEEAPEFQLRGRARPISLA